MPDQLVGRVKIKVTVEMAHEQVLKLKCEEAEATAKMYFWLARGEWTRAGMNAVRAVKARRQLRRIARWL